MGRNLNWIGGLLTALYIGFMSYMISGRISELRDLQLNELGDFLAGAFGPVAFLWLVLGFLQQGEELRQGTKALLLQAEELKNSVAQQSIMAGAATEQIKAQQAALQMQQAEMDKQHQPVFEFTAGSRMSNSAGMVSASTVVRNSGKEIRDVHMVFDPAIGDVASRCIETLFSGHTLPFEFQFEWPKELVQGALLIRYIRLDGSKWLEIFNYSIKPDDPFVRMQRPIGGAPTRDL